MTLVAPLLLIGAMPVAASAADPTTTQISSPAATFEAGGSVVISVSVQDSGNAPVTDATVELFTSLGTISGLEDDNLDGTWTATLSSTESSNTAGHDAVVTGTVDGTPIVDSETVAVTPGPASPDHTLITAAAGPFTVDPTPPSAGLTVQLRDVYDNNLTGGDGTVALTPDAGNATISNLNDNADGTWSATVDLTDHVPTQVTVSGTLDDVAITTGDAVVDFLPGALSYFTIASIGNQTAGGAFNVDATAYDQWDNLKTDYAGGATVGATIATGLSTSPACTSCASGASGPSYGAFGTWTDGAATASVTAYAAETGRTVTVTDGAVTEDSNSFDVAADSATNVAFEDSAVTFSGQPITTKKGTPIYSVCGAPHSSSIPCDSGSSTPVKAIVRDAYGNPISGAGVTLTAPTKPSGSSLTGTGTTSTTGTDGIASFNPISISPSSATGSVQLSVGVDSTAISALSNTIQLVDDLEDCTGSTCDNLASSSNGTSQGSFAKISSIGGASDGGINQQSGGALDGIKLLTQFQTSSTDCTGVTTQVGRTTDVHIEGGTPTVDYQVALIIPKATLQASGVASRNIAAFNVCFGATFLGSGSPTTLWQAKTSPTNSTLIDAALGTGDLYWGWLPDCSAKKNPPTLTADNPCISLRTKNADQLRNALGMTKAQFAAVGFMSGDLALVYRTKSPWDAKASIF